jgi:hypothetical protein
VTLLLTNEGVGYQGVPEAVELLKETIKSLYTVFNMKVISHLQVNACKHKEEGSVWQRDSSIGEDDASVVGANADEEVSALN